jgi:hypothetical protein
MKGIQEIKSKYKVFFAGNLISSLFGSFGFSSVYTGKSHNVMVLVTKT